jgi:hypothetical protein
MQQAVDTKERPSNFTGLSLVLFLFLSMLSMMAAYEVSRPSEDIRNSVVATFHEYAAQTADADNDARTLIVESGQASLPEFSEFHPARDFDIRHALASRKAFNARAPPLRADAAS